jgi:hypothetical protein
MVTLARARHNRGNRNVDFPIDAVRCAHRPLALARGLYADEDGFPGRHAGPIDSVPRASLLISDNLSATSTLFHDV